MSPQTCGLTPLAPDPMLQVGNRLAEEGRFMVRPRSLILYLGAGFLTWLLLVGPSRDRYSTAQNALWIDLLKPDGSTVTGTPVAELWTCYTYGLLDYVTLSFERGRLFTKEGVVEVTKPWQVTAAWLEPGPTLWTLALVALVWACVALLLRQRRLGPTSPAEGPGGEGARAPCVPCRIGWLRSGTYGPRMLRWGLGTVLVLALSGAIVCPPVSCRRCTLVKLVQAHSAPTGAGVEAILGPPTFRVPDNTENVWETTLVWQQNGRTVYRCGVDRQDGVTWRGSADPLPVEALQ
jgi:hypothetical protein